MSRETFQSLRMLLMEKLDLARELTDEEILEEIDTLILERMRDSCLSLKEKVQLRQELFHSVRKLDVLQELIEDETVTEIMVIGVSGKRRIVSIGPFNATGRTTAFTLAPFSRRASTIGIDSLTTLLHLPTIC